MAQAGVREALASHSTITEHHLRHTSRIHTKMHTLLPTRDNRHHRCATNPCVNTERRMIDSHAVLYVY